MQRIKIGIVDEETKYVKSLSAYLQRYGKEKWELYAFTSEEQLDSYLEKRNLDILVATDKHMLIRYGSRHKETLVWLTDHKDCATEVLTDIYSIYRFQSAEVIAKFLEELAWQILKPNQVKKPMIAIYSPVGRCGKTTLALELANRELYGKWLYFGLEDYSSFSSEANAEQKGMADEVLYYWKERKSEQMLQMLEQIGNVVATGSSFVDGKQIGEQDMAWFKQEIQKSDYRGVIFDMGTGIVQDLHILWHFEYVLVPYVEEEKALIKKKNFQSLLALYGLDEKENIHFLTMDKKLEVAANAKRILDTTKYYL